MELALKAKTTESFTGYSHPGDFLGATLERNLAKSNTRAAPPASLSLLLFLGIASSAAYPFQSGTMQPFHYILLLFAALAVTTLKVNCGQPLSVFLPMFFLCFYSIAIEAFFNFTTYNVAAFKHAAFLTYNCLIAYAVSLYCYHYSLRTIGTGVQVATTLSLTAAMLSLVKTDTFRVAALFNNPNQLGYYSLCIASLATAAIVDKSISAFIWIAVIAGGLLLSLVSLSKAAVIAYVIASPFLLVARLGPTAILVRKRVVYFLCLLGACATVFLFYASYSSETRQENAIRRLTNWRQERDSTLEARGYLLFLERNVAENLVGTGIQNVYDDFGKEVHSTAGNVLACYGIAGFAALALHMFRWLRLGQKYGGLYTTTAITAGPLLYGLSHNGIRFTIFWVLVGATTGMWARSRPALPALICSRYPGLTRSLGKVG